jgi:hypothetical protein
MIFNTFQEPKSNQLVKRFEKAILIHKKKRFEEEIESETFLRESGSLPNASTNIANIFLQIHSNLR